MRMSPAIAISAVMVLSSPMASAWAAAAVGAVDRVQGDATAAQPDKAARTLASDAKLLFQDRLQTGAGARLQATLTDGTQLTLGENGHLTIDDFVYTPGRNGGDLAVKVSGAFLFVSGKVEAPAGGNVVITTPVGTLGVRGTTVWGGFIDSGYGVLVLSGEVGVQTPDGLVTLKKDEGTMIYKGKAPTPAKPWSERRLKAAMRTITFVP